jgi:hypothetical protein
MVSLLCWLIRVAEILTLSLISLCTVERHIENLSGMTGVSSCRDMIE